MKLTGWRKKIETVLARMDVPKGIGMTISLSFTVLSIISLLLLGGVLYNQFTNQMQKTEQENSEQLLAQTAINLEDYLRSMRGISDAMYYSVIKNKDLSVENLDAEMNLLYEANKNKLVSIACFKSDGTMLSAAPVATIKENSAVASQEWFIEARMKLENFHFSIPHVQNLFDDPSYRYYWVLSLSRSVELTEDGSTSQGVLLVDMNYGTVKEMLDKVNDNISGEYVYLMDSSGAIIYHPKQNLIGMDVFEENNLAAAEYADPSTTELFGGQRRIITQRRISYTGWRLVSVTPLERWGSNLGTRYLLILLFAISVLALTILNTLVSNRIAKPLQKLNDSVRKWEAGEGSPDIYIGGSQEVEHLGRTLKTTVDQIRQLMEDILVEQEEKRKSELDALQSQINPHFLYNTLDSIVWMITGERYEEAVFMITELASLFRISLSSGRTIISVEDELKHAKNYINIQKVRYKNAFEVEYRIDPDILKLCTVKLIVQPILENAIYYGMEFMDGEGEILVSGYKEENGICLEVSDNGLGMPEEEAALLLTEGQRERKRGSGVGLINVHSRIQLRFGAEYGLEIKSYPDEGMTVRIHLPAIPYTGENQKLLEEGHYRTQTEERV